MGTCCRTASARIAWDGAVTNKRYTPPPKRSPAGKRRKSRLRLCLHVKRGGDGKAEPEEMHDGTPLWRFVVRGHLRNGTPKTKTFAAPDWREAEIVASKNADEWARVLPPAPVTHTMNELADLYLTIKKSKGSTMRTSTVLDYERRIDRLIRPLLGSTLVDEVTPDLITRWIAINCPATLKARTCAHRLGLLSSLILLAIRRKWILVSPILPEEHRITVLKQGVVAGQIVGDERKAMVFTREEVARIVRRLDPGDPGLRMLVAVTARAGFRLREACHLRMRDVRVHPNGAVFLTVASGYPCSCTDCRANGLRLTKAGEGRVSVLGPESVEPFLAHLAERTARFGPDGWLFPVWRRWRGTHFRPGDLRSPQSVTKGFKKAAERSDIHGARFHDLRSTCKQTLLAEGGVAAAVDYSIGHRMPGMTQVYSAWADDLDQFYRAVFPTWQPKLTLTTGAAGELKKREDDATELRQSA